MKKSFLLNTVEEGCSRRALLKGLGVAAAVMCVPGCMQQGSDLPSATTSTCGISTCIDLSQKANAALASPGGALLFDLASDTVMVIRVSDTQVIALSAICTHAGCSMNFDSGKGEIVCPCHGSVFAETGAVITGPARRPLKVYTATLANNIITVTA